MPVRRALGRPLDGRLLEAPAGSLWKDSFGQGVKNPQMASVIGCFGRALLLFGDRPPVSFFV